MKDLILYRNEWYEVNKYHNDYVILMDDIGNQFNVKNKDIQMPKLVKYYA